MERSQTAAAMRVMLVGQYPVLRQSLREIIEREGDLAVVAEARDVEEAAVAARALQPDAVVLDASLASEEGIAELRRSRTRKRALRVICVSITCDREHVIHALRAGACGFLRTEDASEELVAALRLACAERPYLGAAVNREEVLTAFRAAGRQITLLVIEDEAEVAEGARGALESAGYAVLTAASSEQALALVKATRPDAILLGVKVPACSEEFGFVWALRKDDDVQIRNTPVLVLTSASDELPAGASPEDPGALWRPYEYLPVQDFICRPLRPSELLEKVGSLVPVRAAR
ncbi:MAG: response regulator [Armatimonadota bacterium]